jgi:hypothetical protein
MQDHPIVSDSRSPIAASSPTVVDSSKIRSRRASAISAFGVAAVVVLAVGWTSHATPSSARLTTSSAEGSSPQPAVPRSAGPVGETHPPTTQRAVASAVAKQGVEPDRGDQLVVVPDPASATAKIVWRKELGGVTATLQDNGIVGFSRKLDPGEVPEHGKSSFAKESAVVAQLQAEAQDYMKAHLVTMRRRDYEAMVVGEEDERAARQAEREAATQAELDKEGVPPDQRHAVARQVFEPTAE